MLQNVASILVWLSSPIGLVLGILVGIATASVVQGILMWMMGMTLLFFVGMFIEDFYLKGEDIGHD